MTNISPGELATGQYITILKVKPYKVLAPSIEGPKEVEIKEERHALRGVPLKIYGIQLPFISAGNILDNTEGFKGVTINLNDHEIMEVSEEYANGYKSMVERKTNKGGTDIGQATAVENNHDHQLSTEDDEEGEDEPESEEKEEEKVAPAPPQPEKTVTLTESQFNDLRTKLFTEGVHCALEEIRKKQEASTKAEAPAKPKTIRKATKPTKKKNENPK